MRNLGEVLIVAACVSATVGALRDVQTSERENPGGGWFGGTLRPATWGGFRRGLPFYVVAVVLIGIAAFGGW